MDLHFHGPDPTAAEQAAVDSVLGPPPSAWAGGPRNVEGEGHSSRAGRPRGPVAPRPSAARAPCGPVAVWLGPAGCPRLYLPAPDGAPRRGARGRHLLPPLLARATAPWPLPMSVTTSPAGSRGRSSSVPSWSMHSGLRARAAGSEARVWVGANRLPLRWCSMRASRRVRSRSPPRPPPRSWPPGRRKRRRFTAGLSHFVNRYPNSANRSFAFSGGLAGSIPRAWTPIEPRADTSRWRGRSRSGPEGVIREVLASKLMGRGGAAFPTGRKWDAVAKAPRGPTTSSAMPTSRSRAHSKIAY